ncbi:MAG: PLP-dependent aminotransferase family protein [Kiloniellales bacterium]
MTNWLPDLSQWPAPRYVAIADALAAEVAAGRFKAGDRLPTHRDLAWRLGVTVGTVSRAYAEAERRGLVGGEVGRGTFVRGLETSDSVFHYGHSELQAETIDLGIAAPPAGLAERFLGTTLEALARDPRAAALLAYQPAAGRPEHRAAGAEWLARRGYPVPPDRIVVTNGGNHGVIVALAATTRPGDRVLTESLSYALIRPIARMLGLRLEGVAADEQGLRPEAVAAACRKGDVTALYCIPTLQNPTTAVMPEARRSALAEVARRHDFAILEDDIFARLVEPLPPTIARLVPERGFYITSLSKTLAPGLRVGYVAGPAAAGDRLAGALRTTCMMASPIPAEIAARWIGDGSAERLLAGNRRELTRRRELALEILDAWQIAGPVGSLFLWLHLPAPWRAAEFAAEARRRGVEIAPADAFAVDRGTAPANAVRIGLGPPRDRDRLAQALERLAEMLRGGPDESIASIV